MWRDKDLPRRLDLSKWWLDSEEEGTGLQDGHADGGGETEN